MVALPQPRAALFGPRDPSGIRHPLGTELLGASLIVAVFSLLMLLPYLPGRFDASASTMSFLAQLASFVAAFLLIPIGVAWVINPTRSYLWIKLTLGLAAVIVFVLTIAAIAVNQLALGFIIGTLCGLLLLRAQQFVRDDPAYVVGRATRLPFLLMAIPIILLTFRTVVLPTMAEWSRTRAIQHSAPLVREIELFHKRMGHYPVSLHSLNPDVPTGVVGLERFFYEPNGDSYNVFFVRPSIQLDAQEVVVFNPRDEHRFASHELDLLQYDGDHLDLRRGDRRRTQLQHAHWVSILFD